MEVVASLTSRKRPIDGLDRAIDTTQSTPQPLTRQRTDQSSDVLKRPIDGLARENRHNPNHPTAPYPTPDHLGRSILCAILGMGIVFSVLPGIGSIIFGDYTKAAIAFAVTIVCVAILLTQINAMTRAEAPESRES